MNFMFNTWAMVSSSIFACRLFISLSSYLKHDIHQPQLPSHTRTVRSSGNGNQVRAGVTDDYSHRATIAQTVFRIMGEGVDSMGQMYSVEDFDATTRASMHDVLDLAPDHDFGGGGGEVVHAMHGREQQHVKVADLEKANSSSDQYS